MKKTSTKKLSLSRETLAYLEGGIWSRQRHHLQRQQGVHIHSARPQHDLLVLSAVLSS